MYTILRIIRKLIRSFNVFMSKIDLRTISFVGNNVRLSRNLKVIGGTHIHLGDNIFLGDDCRIEAIDSYGDDEFKPVIRIGNGFSTNARLHIGSINRVVIGSNVLIGTNVLITDHAHGRSTLEEKNVSPEHRHLYSKGPVIIGSNSWICDNCVILPNVTLGENVTVAAGAIVTSSFPSNCVIGGNPARILKRIKS